MKFKFALAIGLLCATSAFAQPRGGRGGLNARFERNSPKTGSLLPDVSAYDENGKKFKLRSLKGSYTVLVFGCLT